MTDLDPLPMPSSGGTFVRLPNGTLITLAQHEAELARATDATAGSPDETGRTAKTAKKE